LKVAVTTVSAVKLFMVHVSPDGVQPDQVTDVELPVSVAVNVIAVPLAKFALHVDGQLMPDGLLLTLPVPKMFTARSGPEPVPVKQMTFAVIKPVTIAPDEDRFPALLFVFTVAEIRLSPHPPLLVTTIRPVEVTVTKSGVSEPQVT